MDKLTLTPFERPFKATVTPPGSKSLTNRALVLAALANGESRIFNMLFADDTRVMLDGLGRLGFKLEIDGKHAVRVQGRGGLIPASAGDLYCGNSGTTIRFLTALCALGNGQYVLDGDQRMRERPIGQLADLLSQLGATVRYRHAQGYPPIVVEGEGLRGGHAQFPTALSSQFLSAVLMAAPYAQSESTIDLSPDQTSWPYAAMTIALMKQFGVEVDVLQDDQLRPKSISVMQGVYARRDYAVEPDASSATYFLATAALRPGSQVTIAGLGSGSLQGDVGFASVLEAMGAEVELSTDAISLAGPEALRGIEVDMSMMPDAAMTLAAVAPFAIGQSVIRGLHTLRVKETDRLAALQSELRKLGARAEVEGDALLITPPAKVRSAEIETYNDHRMAMSFAIVGTRTPGVTIVNPGCVSKTYPAFFTDLEALRE